MLIENDIPWAASRLSLEFLRITLNQLYARLPRTLSVHDYFSIEEQYLFTERGIELMPRYPTSHNVEQPELQRHARFSYHRRSPKSRPIDSSSPIIAIPNRPG